MMFLFSPLSIMLLLILVTHETVDEFSEEINFFNLWKGKTPLCMYDII